MTILIVIVPIVISVASILISIWSMRKSDAKVNYLEQDKQYADLYTRVF